MPYIDKTSREEIAKGYNGVATVGALNYAITTVLLAMWAAKPRYETIHNLRRELVTEPKSSAFLNKLRSELADRFTVADIYTAAALAFEEFYGRVGRIYEAKKCREHGDLPGYVEALVPLIQELQGEIKKESASQLILPGDKK